MSSARRVLALVAVPVVALALAGCGSDDGDDDAASGSGTGETGGSAVSIVDFDFEPAEIEVAPGTTVSWTNDGDEAHTVQDESDLGAEESEDMEAGDTFELTYDEPGEYAYICGIHPFMKGAVIVK